MGLVTFGRSMVLDDNVANDGPFMMCRRVDTPVSRFQQHTIQTMLWEQVAGGAG